MILKTRAIVLHHLKYGESSLILTLFTERFGRQAYLINGIRSAKSRQKIGLLQPLFLLEIEAYHKAGRELQRLKEFKAAALYQSIPFDVTKSTMAMFLAELLSKVLQGEEQEQHTFEFIYNALVFFDELEEGYYNFHLWFMVQLLSHVGFRLEKKTLPGTHWFDMKAGQFVRQRPTFPNTPNPEESAQLAGLIGLKADELHALRLNGKERSRLLELLVEYYMHHFDTMNGIKSLGILKEIFSTNAG